MRHFVLPHRLLQNSDPQQSMDPVASALEAEETRSRCPPDFSTSEAEHGRKHWRRQLAGVRILTAGVVWRDDRKAARPVNRTVAEERAGSDDHAARGEQPPRRIESDLAE